jgi:CrcB protein
MKDKEISWTMMPLCLLACGAILGAFSRYFLQVAMFALVPNMPLGTFLANLLGSFIIGGLLPVMTALSPNMRLLLVTGYLGALTTLSSYVFEVIVLIDEKRYALAAAHWAGGAVVCFGGCLLGILVMRRLIG